MNQMKSGGGWVGCGGGGGGVFGVGGGGGGGGGDNAELFSVQKKPVLSLP